MECQILFNHLNIINLWTLLNTMNFTYNNHLKYYLGDRLYGIRENQQEQFKVTVGSIDPDHYKKTNFAEELRRTADLVHSDFGKNIALFLSGGTDSEIVARNFLSIGVKPHCFTIKFTGDYNLSDVNEAANLTKELGLQHTILDFDIKDFYYSGYAAEFGGKIQCTQIAYLSVYHWISKIGLPAVMGGELLLRRNPRIWYYCFRENEDASAMRFSHSYGIPVVNEWFSYTPELMLLYLKDQDIVNLVKDKDSNRTDSVAGKNAILKRLLPEINLRVKTHGFENLLDFNREVYKGLSEQQLRSSNYQLDGIEYYRCLHSLRKF